VYSFSMSRGACLFIVIVAAAPSFCGTPPKSFDQIAKQADAARSADRVNDAISLYTAAIHLRPSWSEGWWSLGSLLYDQDRFVEAQSAFRHFVALTPKPGPAYAFLGLCEYETRDYDHALQHFRAWARTGWSGTIQLIDVAVFHFALLLTREGKFVEALYLLATQAAKLGNTPALSEAMGLASLRLKSLPEDCRPERREMVWLAGESSLYGAQQDFSRADEYAERLLLHYSRHPEVHYFRAKLFVFESNPKEAEREFREELRISPQHVPAMLGLASLDLDDNQVPEAEFLTKQSIQIESNNPEAHHLRGRVLLAEEHFEESAKELEFAKQLAPDSATIRSHLAMAYNHLGREKEAKAEASAFLSLKSREEVLAPPQEKIKPATQARPK
jgi:tetratricopeptide (TPR) repeat protein